MSWSVSEFVATSKDAAKRECEKQVSCNPEEKARVLELLNAALDLVGTPIPGMNVRMRTYGHWNSGGSGGLFIEIAPTVKPIE